MRNEAPGLQLLDLQASGINVAAWSQEDHEDRLPAPLVGRWLSRRQADVTPSEHLMVAFGGVPLSIGACQLSPADASRRDAQWLYLTGVPLADGAPGVAITRRSGNNRQSLTSPELAANFLTAAIFAPTCGVAGRLALRWPRPFGIPGLSGRQLRVVRDADSFRARIISEDRSLVSSLKPESPLVGPSVVAARIRELLYLPYRRFGL